MSAMKFAMRFTIHVPVLGSRVAKQQVGSFWDSGSRSARRGYCSEAQKQKIIDNFKEHGYEVERVEVEGASDDFIRVDLGPNPLNSLRYNPIADEVMGETYTSLDGYRVKRGHATLQPEKHMHQIIRDGGILPRGTGVSVIEHINHSGGTNAVSTTVDMTTAWRFSLPSGVIFTCLRPDVYILPDRFIGYFKEEPDLEAETLSVGSIPIGDVIAMRPTIFTPVYKSSMWLNAAALAQLERPVSIETLSLNDVEHEEIQKKLREHGAIAPGEQFMTNTTAQKALEELKNLTSDNKLEGKEALEFQVIGTVDEKLTSQQIVLYVMDRVRELLSNLGKLPTNVFFAGPKADDAVVEEVISSDFGMKR